jgi:hypothetical protein
MRGIIKRFREFIGLEPVPGRYFDRPKDELIYLRHLFNGTLTPADEERYQRAQGIDPFVEKFVTCISVIGIVIALYGFYYVAMVCILQVCHWIGLLY